MNMNLVYYGPQETFVEVGDISEKMDEQRFLNWQLFPKQPSFNLFVLTIKSF